MLVELHKTRGFKHEVDLFIAQVVLQYVSTNNIEKIITDIFVFQFAEDCVCVTNKLHSLHFSHILNYILLSIMSHRTYCHYSISFVFYLKY